VELSTDRKGAIAELAIAKAAVELGVDVYRPVAEGGRYDLIFELADGLVRVQCKWASRYGDVLVVRCYSARRTRDGLIRRPYEPGEVDAFAAYCSDLDRCYFLPYEAFPRRNQIHLRVARTRNNQRLRINWADDFEFGARLARVPGAIAQLGERLDGIQKVAGSSPAGSTLETA
jgi:PD-(D/E)XK endonuclease